MRYFSVAYADLKYLWTTPYISRSKPDRLFVDLIAYQTRREPANSWYYGHLLGLSREYRAEQDR